MLRTDMFLCATAILAGAAALPAAAAPGGAAVKLNNALEFPVVSFGLQVYDDATAQSLTTMALGVGVRNFFSSVLAGNQQGFGAAIKATKVPRKELFICGSVNTGNSRGGRGRGARVALFSMVKRGLVTFCNSK